MRFALEGHRLTQQAHEERHRRRLEALRKHSGVLAGVIPPPNRRPVALARLRASTNLKMPDCCVLLAAQNERARVASFDDRLTEAAASHDLVVVRS